MSDSGQAIARNGGEVNTGIRSADGGSASVVNSGDATATNGGIANTGVMGAVTVIQHPAPVLWPISVGRIPPLASSFQPRPRTQKMIEDASTSGAGAVLANSAPLTGGSVLAGGGGVGKSQLGSWYAHRALREGADVVVWVDASAQGGIPAAFALAGQRLQIPGAIGNGNPVEDDARAFADWLQATPRRWLVVLDDVADPKEAAKWWPVSAHGAGWVLATSRRRDEVLFGSGRRRVDVDVFTHAEALTYLQERIDSSGRRELLDDDAEALVDELGCLPLALSHAAAYLLSERVTTSAYLKLVRAQGRRLDELMTGDPDNWASPAITVTLLLALNAAGARPETTPALRRAAAVAAVLSPAGHPLEVWDSSAVQDLLSTEAIRGGKARELDQLARFSLLVIDDRSGVRSVRMHALTARAIREHFDASEVAAGIQAAARALLELWPEDPHGDAEFTELLLSNTVTLSDIDSSTGDALWAAPDLGSRLSTSAIVTWIATGRYQDAITYAERAITAAERVLGGRHRDTAAVRVKLIDAYRHAGKLPEAIDIGEAVVDDLLVWLGPDDPVTLEALSALAVAHRQAGDSDRAIALGEQASAGRERVLGPEDPATLESQNNVAVAYWHVGRVADAIALHENVLKTRSLVLGPDHTSTFESRNNLAVAYWQDGRNSDAIELGTQVARDRDRVLGPDHPRTLESQGNLATYYKDAGRTADAVALGEGVLEGHLRVLGVDHHRSLNARHVLAVSYLAAGRVDEAILHEERAVRDGIRVLGPSHRYTLAARANLAACYRQAGRTKDAIELARQVVTDHIASLGARHHNTLRAQTILMACLRQGGLNDEAVAVGEEVVETSQSTLGPEHPLTRAAIVERDAARSATRGDAGEGLAQRVTGG